MLFSQRKQAFFDVKARILAIFYHSFAKNRSGGVINDCFDHSQFSQAQIYRFHSIFDILSLFLKENGGISGQNWRFQGESETIIEYVITAVNAT